MKSQNVVGIPHPFEEIEQKHRREAFWQIIFPIILGAVLLVILAVFSARAPIAQTTTAAEVATIWLIIPMMIVGLISIVITIVLIILLLKLMRSIPPYAQLLQRNITYITKRINKFADLLVEPILRVHSALAVLHTLTHRKKNQSIVKQLYGGGKYE
ncbi:MAG: hypothetical protein ACPL3P_00215 [Anaerolineales bacterium]